MGASIQHDPHTLRKVVLYTDGAARGNPGPAGAGAIAYDEEGRELLRIAVPLGKATNNVAEYRALLTGLEALRRLLGKRSREVVVEVRLDSELVARQLRGEYQVRQEHLWPWFMRIHNLRVATFPHLRITHVPRELNREADALANTAIDQGAH